VRFSAYFGITITPKDDWFDPFLNVDIEAFIDPSLIFAHERGHFVGSKRQVDEFYDYVRAKVLSSRSRRPAVALDALRCPEVADVCLGYTARGTKGAGIGPGLAQDIVDEIRSRPTHHPGLFDVLAFVENIAEDRTSDTAARLLSQRLIKYTQDVCRRHGVSMSLASFRRGFYDTKREEWAPLDEALPHNPFNQRPILLVPRMYLHPTPVVTLYHFWDYCRARHGAKVREVFGSGTIRRPTKRQLIQFANEHPKIWRQYVETKRPPLPYDFDRDPMGVVRWYERTAEYCDQEPRRLTSNSKPLLRRAVDGMTQMFVDYVRNYQGWRMFYTDTGDPLPQNAARLLLMGIVMHCCAANQIEISQPANIGRRTVEFKSPTGPRIRALLLLKFARNTRFWNSLERQLDELLRKDGAEIVRVMVILHSPRDLERYRQISEMVRDVKQSTRYKIDVVRVDGQRPNDDSPSR
jgi:hypothetical protein